MWLRINTVYRGNVSKQVLRKPRDDLSLRPSRTAGIVLNCKEMFLGVHLVVVAGRLFRLGSRLFGVLVVGLDVLGHDLALLGKKLERKSIRFS